MIKKKDRITERINNSFTLINNFITTNKQIMGNLGLSKINLKIETKNLKDKLTSISNVHLLPTASETKERNKLNTIFADSKDLDWTKLLKIRLNRYI